MRTMYLDNAATTKPKQEVIDAMMPYFTERWYNPSSLYSPATMVRLDVEEARAKIAKFINAYPDEIIFTSCGSESNALAIKGSGATWLFTTPIEHKSIQALNLGDQTKVTYILVDNKGKVSEENLCYHIKTASDCFDSEVCIFAQIHANNEVGTVNSVQKRSFFDNKNHILFHVDATQSFGKIPIDVKALGVDTLAASGHKIGCPKGIGILYVKRGVKLNPLITGSQNGGLRGGTENVPYIMGLAKAVELCDVNHNEKMRDLFNYMVEQIQIRQLGKINGDLEDRLFDIVSLTLNENVHGEALVYWLSRKGYYISAGSACNAGSGQASAVLRAIGLSEDEALRTIRITLFDGMTKADVNEFLDELQKSIHQLKNIKR